MYNMFFVCAERDWEAAEEASPQSHFPGWRSVLHQQETERRMAQPLEDRGGREIDLFLCKCIATVTWGLLFSLEHNQKKG